VTGDVTPNPFISFDRVAFSFAGVPARDQPPILSGVSLEIESGDFLCLLGPSGCGKSTLLNILAGFEKPSTGAVSVSGDPIPGPGADRMVVFQGDDSLFPWLTAVENVEFGLRVSGMTAAQRRSVALDALHLVGMSGQGEKYPRQLSGGMKQRIQIARALVLRSKVLLMDEPFAALDAQMRSMLQDELVQVWEATGTTIVFVTHDIAEALILANRIGLMSAGPAARIRDVVEVSLPRPRRRGDAAFGQLYEQLNDVVSNEVRRTLLQGDR
jgi:NitT/TauT family transport system ATP-binding protein